MNKTCKTCRFFEPCEEDKSDGECRRHAPVINTVISDRYFQADIREEDDPDEAPMFISQQGWSPTVYIDDWCGEWEVLLCNKCHKARCECPLI